MRYRSGPSDARMRAPPAEATKAFWSGHWPIATWRKRPALCLIQGLQGLPRWRRKVTLVQRHQPEWSLKLQTENSEPRDRATARLRGAKQRACSVRGCCLEAGAWEERHPYATDADRHRRPGEISGFAELCARGRGSFVVVNVRSRCMSLEFYASGLEHDLMFCMLRRVRSLACAARTFRTICSAYACVFLEVLVALAKSRHDEAHLAWTVAGTNGV